MLTSAAVTDIQNRCWKTLWHTLLK